MSDDARTTMLKAAIAAVLKDHKAVNVKNVKRALPDDFFLDFGSGQMLDSNVIYAEIRTAHAAVPRMAPMFTTTPSGSKLDEVVRDDELLDEDFSGDDADSLRDVWSPETVSQPVVENVSAATDDGADHEASARPLSPQVRLDAARQTERALLVEIPVLKTRQAQCRVDLAQAMIVYQNSGEHWSHEDLARNFIAQSNRERAARVAGEPWAMRPARERRGHLAPVDAERIYGQGGDANAFARRMAMTANRRGAFSKQEAAARGFVNQDPSRGATPKLVEIKPPTIPALAK